MKRALSANGILQEKEIFNFLQPGATRDSDLQAANSDIILNSLHDLIDAGMVTPLRIAGGNNANYYALSKIFDKSSKFGKQQPQPFILSPFDNLMIQRQRIKNLFGYDYSLECYVPASKRKFGYFRCQSSGEITLLEDLIQRPTVRKKSLLFVNWNSNRP